MINERHVCRGRPIDMESSSAMAAMMGSMLINTLTAAGIIFAIGYGWITHVQNRGQRRSRAGGDGGNSYSGTSDGFSLESCSNDSSSSSTDSGSCSGGDS